eukprot:scaffold198643_cov26-Tisochrysis_lutea.AAC.2
MGREVVPSPPALREGVWEEAGARASCPTVGELSIHQVYVYYALHPIYAPSSLIVVAPVRRQPGALALQAHCVRS